MKNFINIMIIVFFSIILLFPSLAEIFPLISEIENTENRAMKSFPKLKPDSIDSFPGEFDEFYIDNIKLRDQLLRLNSNIKFHWFNIPPHSGKAFIGKKGWMYAIKDEMDHYLGRTLLSNDSLDRFVEIIEYRKHILDSMNCKYYIAIVPIKTTIYPEYLPYLKKKIVDATLADQIMDTLSLIPEINIIDLRAELINHKKEYRLFHKTDNHWNEYGGFVAYKAIMEFLSKDFAQLEIKSLSDYEFVEIETKGKNLTNMMGIYDGVSETDIKCKPLFKNVATIGAESGYKPPNYFPYKDSYERVYITDDTSKPKLLLIQDSFGSTLIPFLSEHFSKSVYIFDGWQHNLNEDILYNEKPDIFIQLVSESFLSNIPKAAKKP